jgi:hypothetical protein
VREWDIFYFYFLQPFFFGLPRRCRIASFYTTVAFENSRVAAPTFWRRVGGFHENCLRMARYRLLEIKVVSASRVVFVARSFFEMLGTPKGRGIGSPFFAYFLWRSKESELSPGNPRLGGSITVAQSTPTAQIASLSAPYKLLLANIILHNEKQIPRKNVPG